MSWLDKSSSPNSPHHPPPPAFAPSTIFHTARLMKKWLRLAPCVEPIMPSVHQNNIRLLSLFHTPLSSHCLPCSSASSAALPTVPQPAKLGFNRTHNQARPCTRSSCATSPPPTRFPPNHSSQCICFRRAQVHGLCLFPS